MDSLEQLTRTMRDFVEARNWQPFQSPKNLTMALTREVGELSELFQWLTQEESRNPGAERRQRIAEEMSDVLLYLVRIADELDIDLIAAATEKCEANARKYDIETVKGVLRRRDEY